MRSVVYCLAEKFFSGSAFSNHKNIGSSPRRKFSYTRTVSDKVVEFPIMSSKVYLGLWDVNLERSFTVSSIGLKEITQTFLNAGKIIIVA